MRLRAVVLSALLLVGGCGGDPKGSGEGPGPAADVTGARAQVEKYKIRPVFVPPGPVFDARIKLEGKKIFEIPITSEVPFIGAVEKGMKQAAEKVGAELVVYPNQGDPAQWAQGIRAAIAARADAITLLAQDPSLLGPQIQEAEKAGIPVIVLRTTGEGEACQQDAQGMTYGTACVPAPFEQAGRLEADWVIAETAGKANVLVITSNDARSTTPLVAGMRSEFEQRCPACKVRYVDVPIPDWAARIRTEVQSALVREPDLNYVIPIYDSMSQFAVPAIVAGGKSGRVKIAAFNGTPFVLGLIQEGEIVAMDVGENLAWVGWASMDQTFRVVAGEQPVQSEHTPLRVFDDTNVDETGRPPRFDAGYGNAFVTGYEELWGVR